MAIELENAPVFVRKMRKSIHYLLVFAIALTVMGCFFEVCKCYHR